jgi:glycosyltransferase involved in cell wall biosynthesis
MSGHGRSREHRTLRVAMFQPTFNSTTIGWIQGLEERGHEVINMLPGRAVSDPVGGIDGIEGISPHHIDVVANVNWSRRLAMLIGRLRRRKKSVRRYSIPSVFAVRRHLRDRGSDIVMIKEDASLRALVVSLAAWSLGLARVQWFERPPNHWSRRSRMLTRFGVLPRTVFTTNDPRPGGVGLPDEPLGFRRIPYAAPLWPSRQTSVESQSMPGAGPIRILTVASFKNERKRPWWTLEAAERAGLLSGDHDLRFTFVGAGGESSDGHRRVKESAARFGVADRVELLTRVPYSGMWEVFDGHHLMVLPCQKEPFGMSVVEALARGIPAILDADAGSVGCIVAGVNGAVYPADDIGGLAHCLAELVAEPSRLGEMSQSAEGFVAKHLARGVVAEKLEQLLFEAMGADVERPR